MAADSRKAIIAAIRRIERCICDPFPKVTRIFIEVQIPSDLSPS